MHALARIQLCVLLVAVGLLRPAVAGEARAPLPARILADLQVRRGLCVIVGKGAVDVAVQLARETELLIDIREPDGAAANDARERLHARGLYGVRVLVDHGPLGPLPYADSLVDVLFCASPSRRVLSALRCEEALRVLRPGGQAILGYAGRADTGDPARLREWSRGVPVGGRSLGGGTDGTWLTLTRRAPTGLDDWSHWQHGPDNNPVSRDAAIKPPYRTQFLAEPWFTAVPSVSVIAGGRCFRASGHLATHRREERYLNTLYVTSAYNGTLLWTRPLPEGYLTNRSLFVATADTLYLVDGSRCLVLDAGTGAERDTIEAPTGDDQQWKWIALQQGVLYGLIGSADYDAATLARNRRRGATSWADLTKGEEQSGGAWGTGGALVAVDTRSKRLVWQYRAEAPVNSRSLCMAADRVFFHAEGKQVACLDARTGKPLWKNSDQALLKQVENPLGPGTGFQTTPYTLCSEEILYFGGQGRREVVAVSAADGKLLWTVPGAFNATNLILDRGLLTGHTPSCALLDATTGKTVRDPGLNKLSCARLTASPGVFFYRGSYAEDEVGEGTVRFDAATGNSAVSHAFRPPCNDGAIPANGLLHLTQWDCETNMQLVGAAALAPARAFSADAPSDPLLRRADDAGPLAHFVVDQRDWPTPGSDSARSSSSAAQVLESVAPLWEWKPSSPSRITAAVTAGGLVFVAGGDGIVRALEARTGDERWHFATAGPIRSAPTVWSGRVYVGSADGAVYALGARDGRLLWRFRAAPTERKIMVYATLSSTWPVNSGVLVEDGTAYFAAGILHHDGTHVYAVDAGTGQLKWHNATSGELNRELGAGVSAQGGLALADGMLWLAGGNVVSPAGYELATGRCVNRPPGKAAPTANRGREVVGFLGKHVMVGGPRLFTQEDEESHKWFAPYEIFSADADLRRSAARLRGRTPPAFGNGAVVIPGQGALVCLDASEEDDWVADPKSAARRVRWKSTAVTEGVSIALAADAAVAVGTPSAGSGSVVAAIGLNDGDTRWQCPLPGEPIAGGTCLDREGRVLVSLRDGRLVCFGAK